MRYNIALVQIITETNTFKAIRILEAATEETANSELKILTQSEHRKITFIQFLEPTTFPPNVQKAISDFTELCQKITDNLGSRAFTPIEAVLSFMFQYGFNEGLLEGNRRAALSGK